MKKSIIVFLVALFSFSCTESEDPEGSLMVKVKYKYQSGENETYPVSHPIPIYLFEEIHFPSSEYKYKGNGMAENENGDQVTYSYKEELSSGFALFENLPVKTYGVVLDMLDSKIEASRSTSININSHDGEADMNFEIDIWPYDPWDLY